MDTMLKNADITTGMADTPHFMYVSMKKNIKSKKILNTKMENKISILKSQEF